MNTNPSPDSTTTTATTTTTTTTLTGCTINRVQGNQFNNSNNTTNIVHGNYISCHATEVVKRTEYSEFREVIRGDVIALHNIHHEDLSKYEWQFRGGRGFGRLKACVTTQTIALYPYKDNKFTLVKYDGPDAENIWKRDFRTFSKTREPGSPQLFAINTSKIPMLIFHHMEFTPVMSMQVEYLDDVLYYLSCNFDDLIKKDFSPIYLLSSIVDDLPDGMQGPAKQLRLSRDRLRYGISSPKEWDQVIQQLLHFFHVWGLEIDSEAGKKDNGKWLRLKDSGSIQELDDDDKDFLNNATSSSTKPNSGTCSTQKDEDIRTSTRHNHSITSDHPMNTNSDDYPSMVQHPAPHSPTFVENDSTRKRKRNDSVSNTTRESFASIRANKRFKPASSKKQQLLENARKRLGLRGRKHGRQ